MRKRIVTFLAAFMLTTGAGMMIMSPANAAKSQCPYGYFCTWTNTNYSGTFDQYLYDTIECRNAHNGVDNTASSVYNNRPFSSYMYKGSNCTSTAWLVSAFQSYSTMPSGWDNQLSSLKATA
jgi:hypothetical protein